ncbi:MAG: YcxB family protein [Lachnospiraceae bacterium]|nr:YcxB family protein [Lachnospiraceae bacterium]
MPIRAEYEVNAGDCRKALYFGLRKRYRNALRLMLVALSAVLVYLATVLILKTEIMPLFFIAAGAFLLWGLMLVIGTEVRLFRIKKDPDSMLGKKMILTIDGKNLTAEIPHKKANVVSPVRDLAYVFELKDLFMLYPNPQETYILPKRALQEAEVSALQTFFHDTIPDRFLSPLYYNKKKR